jgi:hypothetical protein
MLSQPFAPVHMPHHQSSYLSGMMGNNTTASPPPRCPLYIDWLIKLVLHSGRHCYLVSFSCSPTSSQQNSCYTREVNTKQMQKPVCISNLTCFSSGYQKCMFVDFFTGYIGPPTFEDVVLSLSLRCNPIFNI